MSAQPLASWAEIASGEWPNLLLGNGFSINIHPDFGYSALLRESGLPAAAKALFAEIGTQDFETVMRVLAAARSAARALEFDESGFSGVYDECRRALIEAVQAVHVRYRDLPRRLLAYVGSELARYDRVFTTNYDPLPYWATMEAGDAGQPRLADYFGPDPSGDLVWQSSVHGIARPGIHFLHGGLHLTQDPYTGRVTKTRSGSSNLLDAVIRTWSDADTVPLFVSEGTSEQKSAAISASPYLLACHRSLETMQGGCVVVGHSLGRSDAHITAALRYASVPLAIGLHGEPDEVQNDIERISGLFPRRVVTFFPAAEHPLAIPELRSPGPGEWLQPAERVPDADKQ